MKNAWALLAALGISALSMSTSAAPASTLPTIQVAVVTSCAPGETYVKGYKKADGTVVSGYCRHNATSAKECAKGETYVHGYTKTDGTQVKGYCRK